MQRVRALFEDQIFHLRISGLLARLAEKHHQDDPFHLLDVDFIGFGNDGDGVTAASALNPKLVASTPLGFVDTACHLRRLLTKNR